MPLKSEVRVGREIPQFTAEPISRTTLALYAGASGDHNPMHIDIDFARRAGMDDVIAHGMLGMAYLGRALTRWVPQTAVRQFSARFLSMTRVGDQLTCRGKVAEIIETGSEHLARVELSAANQEGDVKLVGQAMVILE